MAADLAIKITGTLNIWYFVLICVCELVGSAHQGPTLSTATECKQGYKIAVQKSLGNEPKCGTGRGSLNPFPLPAAGSLLGELEWGWLPTT